MLWLEAYRPPFRRRGDNGIHPPRNPPVVPAPLTPAPRRFSIPFFWGIRCQPIVILIGILVFAARAASAACADEAAACAEILQNHLGSINGDFKTPDGPVTSVHLEGDDSVQLFDSHLVLLKQFKSLTALRLTNSAITTRGLKELKDHKSLTALEIEQFTGRFGSGQVRIGDSGVKEIAEIESLTTLALTGTGITDAGLSELKKLKNLTSVRLNEPRVTDAGLKEVGQIANLKELRLDGTKTTDSGLAKRHELANLEQLILVRTRVTEAGLKEMRHFKRLTVLRMWGVRITTVGVAYLKELQGLKALAIAKSEIGEKEFSELKEAFPDAQISTSTLDDFYEIPDGNQKILGAGNPVVKKILNQDVKIAGEWRGSRRPLREGNVLTIEEEPGGNGSYRLEFSFWTDYSKPQREKRTGKLANGIITLDKPVRKLGLARDAFDVLYTVRVDGKEFLLPSVHAEHLKSADELNPKIAYELHERVENPR